MPGCVLQDNYKCNTNVKTTIKLIMLLRIGGFLQKKSRSANGSGIFYMLLVQPEHFMHYCTVIYLLVWRHCAVI